MKWWYGLTKMWKNPFCDDFMRPAKTHRFFQVAPKDVALAAWRALYEEIVALRINGARIHMISAQIEF